MNKSEELIACLEGEIAKRDEELAACRVAVENCEALRARIADLEALSVTKVMLDIVPGDGDGYEVYAKSVSDVETKLGALGEENEELQFERDKLRAELAAIKAQEPVAWVGAIEDGVPLLVAEPENWKATPLYAAPVSEAKAQGVVMPEDIKAPAGGEWGAGFKRGYEAYKREFIRLNAAHAQRVSVPDERIIPTSAELVQWAWEEEPEETRFQEGYNAAKRWVKMQIEAGIAAPAAPAADAGLVEALEQAKEWLEGWASAEPQLAVINQALAAHRAKGVV